MASASPPPGALRRVIGVPGAVLLGLGSILGTGVFVGIGVGAQVAGSAALLAVVLAAFVASFNGLSSAQLAAAHPVSGGTYAYGRRYLGPGFGFAAGLTFLCAKSASAATAALGFAGYALTQLGVESAPARTAVAVVVVVVLTGLAAGGLSRSTRVNAVLVGSTLLALGGFVAFGLQAALRAAPASLEPFELEGLPRATALAFVAYTGYGRVATLGEEVREPARTIPIAVIATLVVTAVVYALVAFVALAAEGPAALAAATGGRAAPLAVIARGFGVPGLPLAVTVGAALAMLGVLLNLILGLSRVLLAMAREGDAPRVFARVEADGAPRRAVLAIGALILGLALIGQVRLTWSLSAFTVLVYYALTNLAALRLPPEQRRFPRAFAVAGLVSCAGLAVFVSLEIVVGGLLALGLALALWSALRRGLRPAP